MFLCFLNVLFCVGGFERFVFHSVGGVIITVHIRTCIFRPVWRNVGNWDLGSIRV